MKTIVLSMLAVAALASCKKEVNQEGEIPEGNPITLSVKLPGIPSTYGVENPQAAGALTPYYDSVVMYLIYGTGDGAAAKPYAWPDDSIKTKAMTIENVVPPKEVIVVVNGKNMPVTPVGNPDFKTTKKAIEDTIKAQKIENQNLPAKTIAADDAKGNAAATYTSLQQVTLVGRQTAFTTEPGKGKEGRNLMKAAVQLKALVSRFEAGTIQGGEGLQGLVVEAAYINYFYSQNDSIQDTPGKLNVHKIAYTYQTWPNPYKPTWATDLGSTDVTSVANTKAYAYQVFAGLKLVPHIIYKLSGTLLDGYELADGTKANGSDVPFTGKYVTITGFKEGSNNLSEITAHNVYKMGLTGGGITILPLQIQDKPEYRVDFKVNITVADWTISEITPDI